MGFPIIITPPPPHTHLHPLTPGRVRGGQGFFEVKFEITVFEKEVSRFEKSAFEINDFSRFFALKFIVDISCSKQIELSNFATLTND